MARPRGSREQRQRDMRLAKGAGKMLGYIRVSTTGQEQNGHSLDGQITRLKMVADAEGLQLVDVVQDVESGAKQRDGLDSLWKRIRDGEAEGCIIMRLDRLGRSLKDLAALIDEAKKLKASILAVDGGWQIRHGEEINAALPVLMGIAEMERGLISRRTKEGLAAARQKGVRLGRPAENVGPVAERVTDMRRQGMPIAQIAATLNAEGVTTARGTRFSTSAVYRMIERTDPTANPEGGHRGKAAAA